MAFDLGPINDPLATQAIEPSITEATPGEVQGANLSETFNSDVPVRAIKQEARIGASGEAPVPFDGNSLPDGSTGFGASTAPLQVFGPRMQNPRVTLQPDDANAQAKAAGAQVTFTQPVADTTAQSIIDDHISKQQSDAVIARNGNSVLSGQVGRFATSAMMQMADPLNLAAMMIPAAPEAFVAEKLMQASSVFERGLIRGAAGAVNGAAGMAALEPLNYAMSKSDYNDWNAGDALRNIFMGAALGAGGHMLMGGLFGREHLKGSATPEEAATKLTPDQQNTAMETTRAAIGQAADDRPVDVAAIPQIAELNARADAIEKTQMDPAIVGPQIEANMSRRGAGTDYALSPSANDIRSMVKDGGQGSRNVRAFLDEDGNVAAIWPSWDLIHHDMADVGGGSIPALANLASDPLRSVMIEPSRQGLLVSNNNIESGPGAHQSNPMPIKDYVAKYLSPAEGAEAAPKAAPAALRAQADAAAKGMAERAMNPPTDPVLDRADRLNKAAIETAPQATGVVDKDLAEATKLTQDLHQQLQAEIAGGRIMETQEMRDHMLEADHTENVGKASAGYAACLAGKGLV